MARCIIASFQGILQGMLSLAIDYVQQPLDGLVAPGEELRREINGLLHFCGGQLCGKNFNKPYLFSKVGKPNTADFTLLTSLSKERMMYAKGGGKVRGKRFFQIGAIIMQHELSFLKHDTNIHLRRNLLFP